MNLRGWSPQAERFDLPLACALALLAGVGLLVVYAAGGQPLLLRHLARLTVGVALLAALAHVEPRRYAEWAPWFYAAVIAALLGVLLFGSSAKGAQRWLSLGGFQVQPSELAKIAIPLAVAGFLARRGGRPRLSVVFGAAFFIALPVFLVGRQPDLGTAAIIAVAGAGLLFASGVRWRLVAVTGAASLAAVPLVWYVMKDYQRSRLITFLDPERNPLGAGYHIIQSKIAIGSGGIYGKGWLNGTQSQLDFLPERSTDFVFSVLAEEFGLLGVATVLTLFGFVVLRGFRLAMQTPDLFARLVAAALVFSFFLHVFVNVGMVSGLFPVVGLPLPLISYGGTSMVSSLASFGIVMAMSSHRRMLTE